MEIKYNDTFSTSHSSDDVFDFIEKDTTILKGSRNESTSLPKSTEVNSNETLSSGYKPQSVQLDKPENSLVKGTVVEVKPILLSDSDVNTTAAFAKSHTRDFYKGRSFRYAGKWELGVHYINDEYITDFVVKDGVFLVCKKSNMSSWGNEPTEWVYEGDQIIAVISDYWEVVLAGGLRGKTYIPEYDEDSDSLIWRLVNPENLPQEFQTYLGIKGYIDHSLVPIQEEIIDIKSDADITKKNVNAIEGEIINLGSDISILEIITGSISTHVEDLEGNFSDFVQTAEGFFFKVGDLENNVGQLWLTSRQFGVQLENAEGDIARLTIEADQISTRVENAEGDISQIFQRADEISTQVENQQGDISRISQKADQIQSEVENQQGDISRITQRADIIESQVQNLDGDVSTISQRADQIQSQVENVEGDISTITQRADIIESQVQNQEGDISRISQTADQIQSQVENLNGDVSTITQRADSIESYVSNLEGDVSIISQTADEISTRVTNAEGSISTLSQTADEISSEVTNLQGDVSTISQRADEIQSQVENVEGDISNITQRADIIESQVQSQAGDISRISQTADQIQSEVSNLEGDVSTVTQRADLIESQVQDVEGDVSTISQRADSIELEVLNQQGDISDIRQTADDINLRVENAEGDIASLDVRADQITSTVADQQGQISQIRQTSEQIASEVAANKVDADNKYTETNSRITQTAAAINLEVARVEGKVDTNARTFTEALGNLQDQIDGAIDTWFYNYAPVHTDEQGVPDSQVPLNVVPYSDWVAAETAEAPEKVRDSHVSDIFYDQHSGYAYRFIGTGSPGSRVYTWVVIQDAAVIKALEDAARAQDTADHKRRVFVTTPYAPYDLGDLWVKSTTVGNVAATELYRCIIAKTTAGTENIAADWAVADSYAKEVSKSNIQILADAIVQQTLTYTYDEYGRLSKETKSAITTGMNDISLAITGSKLETVGIFIRNANTDDNYINLIANKVKIKGAGDHTPTGLGIYWDPTSQSYKISAANLQVEGAFSTTAWTDATTGQRKLVLDDAATAATGPTGYLTEALYGSGGSAASPTGGVYGTINPMTTALSNFTTITGGLILSTELILGQQSGQTWVPWAGMSGVYDNSSGSENWGHGIAAWYGGDCVDKARLTDAQIAQGWATHRWAKSLFRMDGSGYLADNNIWWGASGELHIGANTIIGNSGSVTFSQLASTVAELASYFEVIEVPSGASYVPYLKLKGSGTGFKGFVVDGFISAGGLSSGGGASGTTIEAVWGTLTNNTPVIPTTTTKIAPAHIPIGSGLEIQNGVIVVTAQGTVTGIKIGSTTYTPASGSTTVDISAGIPTVPTAVSAFTNDAGYITSSDIPSSWAWSTITNTPTTLSGYGITDATISNGVVTLGSSTITPVTGIAIGGSGHTNDLAITAGGSTSYVTVPFATTASKLSTVSKTAWGQTYWTSGGVPDSISGNMSSVGNITMTGSISGATTISASTSVTSPIFYLNANTYFVLDSSGYVHLVTPSGKGFYCDGFVSAGGISTGGGTGGIDLDAMWASLTTNTDSHGTNKIHTAHLPTLSVGTGLTASYTQTSATATTLNLGIASGYKLPTTTEWSNKADASALGNYLPLAGGTMNNNAVISRTGSGVSWVNGRAYPIIRTTSYTGYNAILSMKTTSGSWELGVYTDDYAYLTYITDTNYSSQTNTTTYQLTFPKDTGTIALTKNIPTTLPASDVYVWAKAATKPTYNLDEVADGSTRKLANYVAKAGDSMTGALTFSQTSSTRRNGIIGTYDANRAAAIWSMGSSYQIAADGMSLGTLYGAAYVYYGSGYTYGAGKSGGHSFVWAKNGSPKVALGDNVWTSGGFIKDGGTSAQFLKADGSVDGTSYLPLTGGMITSSSVIPLILNTTSSGQSGLIMRLGGTDKSQVGWTSEYGTWLYDYTTSAYVNIPASATTLYWKNTYPFYHSGNSNKIDVAWRASSLTLAGAITGATTISASTSVTAPKFIISANGASIDAPNGSNVISVGTNYQVFGYGSAGNGNNTYIDGGTTYFRVGTSWTTAAIINSSGNVTIGASDLASTSNKLYVNGASGWTSIFDSTSTKIWLSHGSGHGMHISSKSNSASYNLLQLNYNDSSLNGGGTAAMVVRADGNVGVGTTTPAYKLDVAGQARATLLYFTDLTSNIGYVGKASSSSNHVHLGSYNNGHVILMPNGTGKVGVGTVSPTYMLDVNGNARCTYMYFRNKDNNGNAGYIGRGLSLNNSIQIVNEASDDIYFSTGGAERLRIKSSGVISMPLVPKYWANNPKTLAPIQYGENAALSSSYYYPFWSMSDLYGNILQFGGGGVGLGFFGFSTSTTSSPTWSWTVNAATGMWSTLTVEKVGVGVSSPAAPLHVCSNATSGDVLHISNGKYGNTSLDILVYGQGSNRGLIARADFNVYDFLNGVTFYWDYSGDVRTLWSFDRSGNISATGAITAGAASDARLKTNINTMSDEQAKALIMALRPVTFTWNQKATELYDQYKGNDLGFVAQEVENVQNIIPGLSKAIGTIFADYKRLDPVKFIAPIVKVEQDHERRIHELEKAVKERDKKIEELEKRLNMN